MSAIDLAPEAKASVLVEALPYLQQFAGATIVIKHGGSTIGLGVEQVILDILTLKHIGLRPVVIHGGGKDITFWLEQLGGQAKFVDGLRVTDDLTMDVVQMVLAGKVNSMLVARFNRFNGGKAVGLSGVDGQLLLARKKSEQLGWVGEIESVQTGLLLDLLHNDFIPIIAPIGCDRDGNRYNINGDFAAAAIAGALKAEKFFLLTDVDGIMQRLPDGSQRVVSKADADTIATMIAEGDIYGGMVPKVQAALSALQNGAQTVHIVNGNQPHALLLEIFTQKGIGTMVVPTGREENRDA